MLLKYTCMGQKCQTVRNLITSTITSMIRNIANSGHIVPEWSSRRSYSIMWYNMNMNMWINYYKFMFIFITDNL